MSSGAGQDPVGGRHTDPENRDGAVLSQLLEDSVEDLYENAPCGYLSTLMDGQIAKANATLLNWLGYTHEQVVGRMRFSDLLTVGGKLYHETHFAPLLRMHGEIGGIALELKAADGARLPVLVTSVVKIGADGQPLLIRTTLFDARDRRSYERELLRAQREAELERERVQSVIAVLQRSLLPPALPTVPGVQAAAHYHPASRYQVGGDFYDLFPLGAGRWGFFLGDVCGKGPEAAAVTSLTRYTLRAAAVYDPDPVAVLANLNAVLIQDHEDYDQRYCTVIFGVLTPDDEGCDVVLAGGGHPPALLLRAGGGAECQDTPGGQLVGVLATPRFTATSLRLAPGDVLLLYTDGLIEARTGGTARYGEGALAAFAGKLAPTCAAGAIAAVRDLLAGFGERVTDDVALLALGVPPRPAEAPSR